MAAKQAILFLALALPLPQDLFRALAALLVPHGMRPRGKPDYLSAIANATLEALVKQLSGLYPVLVKKRALDCPRSEAQFPLPTYIMSSVLDIHQSFCSANKILPIPAPKDNRPKIISEQMGRNFGPQLPSSQRVVRPLEQM